MGDSDLPAIRYAIKVFMERQAPSNFMKERWAASYDPARKVTYVSWFLGTIAYFLVSPRRNKAAAAAAYAASLLESFEMPREDITVHEAMRRYQALLKGGRRRW